MKLCALSVDLDEIPCYHAIHGLPMPDGAAADAVYRLAVARYLSLFSALGVPCTFFVIGRDLVHDTAREGACALARAGHELGNHTLHHRYDFSRLDDATRHAEVLGGIEAIERATSVRPKGFRAPGYTINDAVFDTLHTLGVAYDSSVFPCPAYWAAKTAKIGLIRLARRRSHSIVDTPAVLTAPADPYVPARPYWRRRTSGEGIIELPIGVTRGARLPYIGTSIMLAGPERVRFLTAQIDGRPLVNLELHGIDLLDANDGLDALRSHQPDVRIDVDRKLATLRIVVEDLSRRGYRFVTCAEAAGTFASGR